MSGAETEPTDRALKPASNNTRKGHPGNDGGAVSCHKVTVLHQTVKTLANGGNGGNRTGRQIKTENAPSDHLMKNRATAENGGKGGAGYLGKNYIAMALSPLVGGSGDRAESRLQRRFQL